MAQSSQFTQLRVTDFLGTVQDVSQYVKEFPAFGPEAEATNVTTLATGGATVADSSVRGALKSEPTITFLLVPALMLILIPLLGNNTGFLWEQIQGTNAAPTFGDEWIGGSYVMLGLHPDSNSTSNEPMTVKAELKVADGASTLPTRNKFGA